MHVAAFVEVDLYASAQEQVVVGGGGFRDENTFVASDREHEPYFHSSVARGFEGGLYAWGGDEIGGLEVDVALRMVEHVADEGFHTHDLVCGVDGEDVDGGVGIGECLSPPPVPLPASGAGELQNAFAFCPIPKEDRFEFFDGGRVGEAQVGIAPLAAVDTVAVASGDVHSADIGSGAVYGDYLAVVSEVDGNTIAGE